MKKIIPLAVLFSVGVLAGFIADTSAPAAERTYTIQVPEHLAFTAYHLLLGDAEQQLSVAKYKEDMPAVAKDIASQFTAQSVRFYKEDSAKAAAIKVDTLQKSAGKQGSVQPKKP